MIRVVGAALGFAILVGFLFHGSQTAMGIAFVIALVGILMPILGGQSALRCPYCRKRVKLGATVCHHCGRAVGQAS